MDTVSDTPRGPDNVDRAAVPVLSGALAIQVRLMAIAAAARLHGAELDRNDLRVADAVPSPAALTEWLRASGLWAKPVRLPWKQLMILKLSAPVVLLLNDGSAVLVRRIDWPSCSPRATSEVQRRRRSQSKRVHATCSFPDHSNACGR